MVLRNATAWTAAVCLASVVGCASSRSSRGPAPVSPQMAQSPPQTTTQVGTEQLIQIGDSLRMQGKYNRAAEVYGWVLNREPNNLAARQRMAMLQANIVDPPMVPPVDRQATRPAPSVNPGMPYPSQQPPPAPGAEEVPAFPSGPGRKSVPVAPGAFDAAMKHYRATSAMPTTVVQPATGGARSTHTIQIIPASKGGSYRVQELRVSEDEPSGAPGRLRIAGERSALPSASGEPQDVPAGMRELANYFANPKAHVAAVTARLQDSSADVRSLAAFLLGRAGDDARSAAPALEILLTSERNGPTRVRVAEALLRIHPEHGLAAQLLIAGLSTSERAVRWEAVCVSDAVRAAPFRAAALSKVIDRLQDVDSRMRVMAALKLGDARQDRAVAEDALEKLLRNPQASAELKSAARISLAALRAESPVARTADASETR